MKAFNPDQLRNVGLFSHGGSGKTSLSEALLFTSKATNRLGRVEDGTTVSDYDPDEVKRRMSVSSALTPCEWNDHKINVIDVPGYIDFIGEIKSAMRIIDTAIILLDANGGVEVGSEQVWRMAKAENIPCLLVINKLDRDNADFFKTLEQARSTFGHQVVPLQIPLGQAHDFNGFVDLLSNQTYTYTGNSNGKFATGPVPATVQNQVNEWREIFIEQVAEVNDELTTKYLEDGTLNAEDLNAGLREGIASGMVVPLLCLCATANIGTSLLLDLIVNHCPSPLQRGEVVAKRPDQSNVNLKADPSGPFAALVWKTLADPFVGRLSYFRVYSGTFHADTHILNANKRKDERVGSLFFMRGKEQERVSAIGAGDIGVVAKLEATTTGDTLCDLTNSLILEGITFPLPTFSSAIHPRSKNDLDKMGTSLHRLIEEDPTLQMTKDINSADTILSGMGESHLQIIADRLQRKFGVNVMIDLPKIPYKETITGKTSAEYKHKKQSGGHGQYGHVVIEMEPLREGEFEFSDRVVGGVVPRQYIPAVEKGVREILDHGPLAGYPVTRVHVTLCEGSYHDVDSSEMAFKIAAQQAFRKGFETAHPTLLEPIVALKIIVPDHYVGDVLSDLNTKRAHVSGMEPDGNGCTTVTAHSPLSEVQRYNTDLRSLTQGRGTFSQEHSHYAEVPSHLASKLVETFHQHHQEIMAHH